MICHVPNTKFYMKTDKKARDISDEIRLVHTKMMQDLALRGKKVQFSAYHTSSKNLALLIIRHPLPND